MKISLHTLVKQDYLSVFQNFDQTLFLALAPPFPKVKLLRFDGSNPGDKVAIRLNFLLFSQTWASLITESNITEQEAYFVDEGQQLPWPLKFWRHRHVVQKHPEGGAVISDLIEFWTASFLVDLLLYPLMWAQFSYRKPIYRKFFK